MCSLMKHPDILLSRQYRWLLLAALCAIFVSGCFERQYRRFSYRVQAEAARQIYTPMTVGQRALVHALAHVACHQVLFALTTDRGGIRLKRPLSEADLMDEAKAVFFMPAGRPCIDGGRLLYFNPRRLSLQNLPPAAAASSKNVHQPSGDLVVTAPGRFSLIRSIPVGSKGERRRLMRFDFAYDGKGSLNCLGRRFLTDGRHFDYMPEPVASTLRVFFLRRESSSQNRLAAVSFYGGDAQAVFTRQDFNVRFAWQSADGRILFSGNPEGYFRLYALTMLPPDADRHRRCLFSPFSGSIAPRPTAANLILANAGRMGDFRPVLVKLPETCDLRTICALVQAQNPRVNRMRALLAAAMIDAGQARLANWPVLSFGILYTPAVGIFLAKPIVTSGDFLAESIARGLIGVVQPLFDFKRNAAKASARYYRAKIAHDNVLNEINERIAEAAALYFEARYLKRLTALQQAQIDTMRRRHTFYQRLRKKAESTLEELLATEQIIDGLQSEHDFHLRRLAFIKDRLKDLCGLPRAQHLILSGEKFAFNDYVPEPLAQLRTTALLNHPALKAARAALSQTFYLERTGSPLRPTGYFSAVYGQSRRDFTNPVDDYITLALHGRYPLAAHRSAKLNDAYWQATLRALQIQRRIQAHRVAEGLEEAYMDFQAARRDFAAKQATRLYRLERLRLARLHLRYGPSGHAQASPVDEISARFDFLEACIRTAKARKDLGLRYARLWREMGLSSRLSEESSRWRREFRQPRQASLWLWQTGQVLKSTDNIRSFVSFCSRQHIRRVYAYLYSDSRLLENAVSHERLTILLNFCDRAGIELWALLGEPEWLNTKDRSALTLAVNRILAFNGSLARFEPCIGGIKIDLEPYSLPGWHTDAEKRRQLAENYIALLQTARSKVKGKLPLWVDIPVQYLRNENQRLLHDIQQNVDGATLMAYFSQPEKIMQNAARAFGRFSKPLEIGIELSLKAPPGDRLPDWPFRQIRRTIQTLQKAWLRYDNYAGMALHDFQGLKKRTAF